MKGGWNAGLPSEARQVQAAFGQVTQGLQWASGGPTLSCPHDNRSLRPGLVKRNWSWFWFSQASAQSRGEGEGQMEEAGGESRGGVRLCSWEFSDSWHQVKL